MSADRHSPERLAVAEVGSNIAIMLVGVLMSVIVTLTGTSPEAPSSPGNGTTEVIFVEGSWGHVAPAIAEVDRDIIADA